MDRPRRVSFRLLFAMALLALWLGSAPATLGQATPTAFDPARFDVGLELVAEGFERPLYVTDANDGSGRLFVVE